MICLQLHGNNISVFAIGVGNDVNETELEIIASTPRHDFMYHPNNFSELNQLIPYLTAAIHRWMYHNYCNQVIKMQVNFEPKNFCNLKKSLCHQLMLKRLIFLCGCAAAADETKQLETALSISVHQPLFSRSDCRTEMNRKYTSCLFPIRAQQSTRCVHSRIYIVRGPCHF